jgi:hypothetical protein
MDLYPPNPSPQVCILEKNIKQPSRWEGGKALASLTEYCTAKLMSKVEHKANADYMNYPPAYP